LAGGFLRAHLANGTILNAEPWAELHSLYGVRVINHAEANSLDGACMNRTEEKPSVNFGGYWQKHVHSS
jgi:hypothetical protein